MTLSGKDAGAPARITVLGGSGFLGTAVTEALADRPVRLRVVTRGPYTPPAGATAEIEVRTADLTARADLADAVVDADFVLWLVVDTEGRRDPAAEAAAERVNVGVPADLVEVLRRRGGPGPVVVYAGSSSQIGLPPTTAITGSEPDHPESGFDRQKHEAERLLLAADAEGVLRAVSLRLPTVFGHNGAGRNGTKGMVAAMARRALAGDPLTVWGDGALARDLLDVRDAAAAVVAAADHADALAGRHWLVGTGVGRPLGEVLRTVARVVGEHTATIPVPVLSVSPPAAATESDLRDVVIDASAFRAVTGWSPLFGLRDGIRLTVAALAGAAERRSA